MNGRKGVCVMDKGKGNSLRYFGLISMHVYM
jgi:hypothetical protein